MAAFREICPESRILWESGNHSETWDDEDEDEDWSHQKSYDEGSRSPNNYLNINQISEVPLPSNTAPWDHTCADNNPPDNCPTNHTIRTLHHPSFEAYYAAVAIVQNTESSWLQLRKKEGFSINNGDYFYTDPLQKVGHRVYNCLSPATLDIFSCFRLNTPPPITCPTVFVSPQNTSLPPFISTMQLAQQPILPSPADSHQCQIAVKDPDCNSSHSASHTARRACAIPSVCTSDEADAVFALLHLSDKCCPIGGRY
ncbi:uncharacterized protein LOC134602088 [Pelobates fuscus]|uniref:uncharacterized protein LOC134602088 n=1 Tax=Pelobates fuscus TaxID=191477 RepID=UPI002FE44E69